MYLVYHRPSGATHVLLPDIMAVLEAAQGCGNDSVSVLTRLQAQYDLSAEDGADPADVVMQRLEELWRLGLIERSA